MREAREAALEVLDFWLERGVDGFRLDVANAYLHDATLTDNPAIPAAERGAAGMVGTRRTCSGISTIPIWQRTRRCWM